MVSMVLSVCTKVAMKLLAHRSFDADDALLTAAMVDTCCIGILSMNVA